MKSTLRLFVILISGHLVPCYAGTYIIDSPITTGVFSIYGDTLVSDNIVLSADMIKIRNTVLLENHGTIKANIFVDGNFSLYFKNSGQFVGDIDLGGNAKLIHLIESDSDMAPLDITVKHSLMVHSADGMSLGRVLNAGRGADKITLHDSRFVFRDSDFITAHGDVSDLPDIELRGDNIIYIGDYTGILDAPLLYNVSGDGRVRIYSDNIDPLYILEPYVADGNMFVRLGRMTNYTGILGDSVGVFLDSVRATDPDDSLLIALDDADSMDGLRRVMKRSARLNPVLFMRHMDVIDSFNRIDTFDFSDSFVVSAETMHVFSDKLDAYGLRLNFNGIKLSDTNIAVSVYGAVADVADDINDFSAISYGANIRAGYTFANRMFVRGMGGASVAHFETGPVFDGTGITYNPVGKSIYATADFGMDLDIWAGLKIAPFIGVDLRRFEVLHENDFVASARIGADMKYSFETGGLRYDYAGTLLTDHNGNIGAALRIGAWSVFDEAGGDASIAVINDEFAGRAYKLSISGRFMF